MKQYSYYIGIDPGKNTGMALYERQGKKLETLETLPIHEAIERVRRWQHAFAGMTFYRVEDARKATYGRQNDIHKAQGAASIKRDCQIWFDFLTDLRVDFEMVRPNKTLTKMNEVAFKKTTRWKGRTSNHARDAAMLVYGY